MIESLGSLKYHYLRNENSLSLGEELDLLFTKSYELELQEKKREFDEFLKNDDLLKGLVL